MEEELEVDPQRAAMLTVIGILTPLRQHRQASAERAQRQAQSELEQMREHLEQSRELLGVERGNQKQRRQTLAEAHLEHTMSLEAVDKWHDQERRMLDRLADIRHDILQQGHRIEQQQASLEEARERARAAQRAVEKLSCLAEAVNDET